MGKTGVRVSEICLGTMTFGKEADEATSGAIMDRALQLGINFFDTANIYNNGASEEIIGRWMGDKRDAIVLATKAHFPTGRGPNDRGSSRRHITMSVESSLKRLRTDRVDLLYLHHWDDETDCEESLRALDALISQGKVLYAAVSNFAAWQVVKVLWTACARGFASIAAIQPMYNLLKRQAEVEILPMAQSERLGVFPYSPQAGGLLTGKYQRGETGRINVHDLYRKRYGDPTYRDVAVRFAQHARTLGYAPGALAVAWVKSHPAVTSAIVGASNMEQFNETMSCLDIKLTPEDRAIISSLSPEPPLATDREK